MSKHALFSLHLSTAVHVAGLVVALAWRGSEEELPHYHVQSGTISIQASFASPEPASQSTFQVSLTPTAEKKVERQLEAILKPAVMEMRPQRTSLATSLIKVDLPADLEACNCEAAEHQLETPKRKSIDEPRVVTEIPEPEPIRRAEPVPEMQVAAEVELPSVGSLGSDVDEIAKPLSSNRLPAYPRGSLTYGQQVQGIVMAEINADGVVESVQLVKSSGVAAVDESALKTIATWRFEPAQRGGQRVASALNVPFRFRNL